MALMSSGITDNSLKYHLENAKKVGVIKEEVLDLYDNKFHKLDKTIVRRKDEIPEGANIMQSYILIKNNNKYLLEQSNVQNSYH